MTQPQLQARRTDFGLPGLAGGKVVVTGGAGGIGQSVAGELLAAGSDVLLLDHSDDLVHTAVRKLDDAGTGRVVGASADVTDHEAVEAALAYGEGELGALTGVVAGAGIRVTPTPFPDVSADEFERQFAVNVSGVFHVCRAAAASMRQSQTRGSIVTIASLSGRQAQLGKSAYCASKAAAIQLTRCMALDLGLYGIRANAVCPGTVATPMIQQTIEELGPEEMERRISGATGSFRVGIPLGRIGEPEEVADTVLFLLSSLSRHISGQLVGVDGGESVV